MNATPGPQTQTLPAAFCVGAGCVYEDGDDWKISLSVYLGGKTVSQTRRQIVAEEIARRWNAYPKLVAATERALAALRCCGVDDPEAAEQILTDALAQARPE